MVKWPGHIKPGSIENGVVSHLDWMPTLLAAAGVPDVKEQLIKGMKVGDTTFKVHLDGYNLLPLLSGQTTESPRKEFFYFGDEGGLNCLRYDNWKIVFAEQRKEGTLGVWAEPFTELRLPKVFNLRTDPLRTRGHHVEHLLGLAPRPSVCQCPGAGHRRRLPRHVQGIPACPGIRQLQHQ